MSAHTSPPRRTESASRPAGQTLRQILRRLRPQTVEQNRATSAHQCHTGRTAAKRNLETQPTSGRFNRRKECRPRTKHTARLHGRYGRERHHHRHLEQRQSAIAHHQQRCQRTARHLCPPIRGARTDVHQCPAATLGNNDAHHADHRQTAKAFLPRRRRDTASPHETRRRGRTDGLRHQHHQPCCQQQIRGNHLRHLSAEMVLHTQSNTKQRGHRHHRTTNNGCPAPTHRTRRQTPTAQRRTPHTNASGRRLQHCTAHHRQISRANGNPRSKDEEVRPP